MILTAELSPQCDSVLSGSPVDVQKSPTGRKCRQNLLDGIFAVEKICDFCTCPDASSTLPGFEYIFKALVRSMYFTRTKDLSKTWPT